LARIQALIDSMFTPPGGRIARSRSSRPIAT